MASRAAPRILRAAVCVVAVVAATQCASAPARQSEWPLATAELVEGFVPDGPERAVMLRLLDAFAGPGLVTRVERTTTRDLSLGYSAEVAAYLGLFTVADYADAILRRLGGASRSLVHRYVELNRARYRVDPRALDRIERLTFDEPPWRARTLEDGRLAERREAIALSRVAVSGDGTGAFASLIHWRRLRLDGTATVLYGDEWLVLLAHDGSGWKLVDRQRGTHIDGF